MPFIILTGFPSSGKSSRANELKLFFGQEHNIRCIIISDHELGIDKNEVYSDSKREKEVRAALKSAIQRVISKDEIVILDSLNYIKGYRYELFCVTKSCQTPQCVIYCDAHKDIASDWNKQRPEEEQYSQDVFDALVMRYEAPESRNRWDSTLFIVHPEDLLPLEEINDALFNKKAPPPNISTQSQPLSSTNFLHELDKTTQSVVKVVLDSQKTCFPGDNITIPGATDKLEFHKHLTLAELQRMRRQFMTFTKMRPVEDNNRICNMFVQFLNNSLK